VSAGSREHAEILPGLYAGKGNIRLSIKVNAIVCLSEGCKVDYDGSAIEYCYHLRREFVSPQLLHKILSVIDKHLSRGEKVYVHCCEGCERTGTVIISYLMIYRGMSLDEAARLFLARRLCLPSSYENTLLLQGVHLLLSKYGREETLRILGSCNGFEDFYSKVYSLMRGSDI
jgi:hypothetical protein